MRIFPYIFSNSPRLNFEEVIAAATTGQLLRIVGRHDSTRGEVSFTEDHLKHIHPIVDEEKLADL